MITEEHEYEKIEEMTLWIDGLNAEQEDYMLESGMEDYYEEKMRLKNE